MIYKVLFQGLKLILLGFSFLIPRNKRIWCFGSHFNGNTKYLSIFLKETCINKRIIWIVEKKELKHLRALGFEAYTRWSFKGVWFCLIAGAYFYNSYPDNVNLYTKGRSKLINLWHGVGLKKMDRQIKTGPLAKYYQSKGLFNELRYLNFRLKPDVMLSTSPFQTRHFIEAVEVSDSHFVEGIYPRCELFKKKKKELYDVIKKYESPNTVNLANKLKEYRYVYMYMPTFRDSGDDFITNCGFDFEQVNDALTRNNRLLIIKMHPDSKLSFLKEYSNIQIVEKDVDIYPILPLTHCLITDYSSIYFDYILMKDKPVILFIPDLDNYLKNSRDLAFPYEEYTKGIVAKDFEVLMALFNSPTEDYAMPDIDNIRKIFWAPTFKSLEELTKAIIERLN